MLVAAPGEPREQRRIPSTHRPYVSRGTAVVIKWITGGPDAGERFTAAHDGLLTRWSKPRDKDVAATTCSGP